MARGQTTRTGTSPAPAKANPFAPKGEFGLNQKIPDEMLKDDIEAVVAAGAGALRALYQEMLKDPTTKRLVTGDANAGARSTAVDGDITALDGLKTSTPDRLTRIGQRAETLKDNWGELRASLETLWEGKKADAQEQGAIGRLSGPLYKMPPYVAAFKRMSGGGWS